MQTRDIVAVLVVALLVLLLLTVLGGGMMWGMMGPWMGGPFGDPGQIGGFAPWWSVLIMLFWVLVIGGFGLLLVWLFRRSGPVEAGGGRPAGDALDILRQRYARGEIDRDEYFQMKRELEE